MPIQYDDAIDEMKSQFWLAWSADTTAIVGYVPETRWQNNEKPDKPDNAKFWVRVSVLNAGEAQSTLSNCVGEPGKKRYTSAGLVYIQLFCPKTVVNADKLGQQLSKVARNAYRGKKTAGGIWFRNVRIIPVNAEELFYRFNIIAEYEYDELG